MQEAHCSWVPDGHLSDLYLRWSKDRQRHGREMVDTLHRIIRTVMQDEGLTPYYRRFEDLEDLWQDLVYICLKALDRVEAPFTNKRIYNFLSTTVEFSLKDKARTVGRRMDREPIESQLLGGAGSEESHAGEMCFGDPLLDSIAQLLSEGLPKHEVRGRLNITRGQLDRGIDRIKANYIGHGYN